MDNEVDDCIRSILSGNAVKLGDLTDIDQGTADTFTPVTKHTVTYIVCAVLFSDAGEVLMMQEAKQSCYGHWYLPAGRMELNEHIVEGAKREVQEETGLLFEPTALITVENSGVEWYRFTVTGRVTGGSLKTTDQKDKESLQARWCSVQSILGDDKEFPLRRKDIRKLIERTVEYNTASAAVRHSNILPTITPHKQLLLRIALVHSDNNETLVMMGQRNGAHLPTVVMSPNAGFLTTITSKLIATLFGNDKVQPRVCGVLSVEHSGKPSKINDGLCLTLLLTIDNSPPSVKDASLFAWMPITNPDLCNDIKHKLSHSISCVKLISYCA